VKGLVAQASISAEFTMTEGTTTHSSAMSKSSWNRNSGMRPRAGNYRISRSITLRSAALIRV
jgi:hypothetical protein